MLAVADELKKALGVSPNAAKLYLASLGRGSGTLTELARGAGLSRTVMAKPIQELLDAGLLQKRPQGKRTFYFPLNPQELPNIVERKKQMLAELSSILLQQISAPDQDLQVKWFTGIAGIQDAIRELFRRSKGNFRQFENADTYQYLGTAFGDEIVRERIKLKKLNKLIVIGTRDTAGWYEGRISRAKEELREVIMISSDEYPFHADIAVSENVTLIFEYRQKPFALLIDNPLVAESIATIHQMVWERYASRSR